MKIISQEEKHAHSSHVLSEGAKGLFYGGLVSAGIFAYLKTRQPVRFASFNTSVKTAILTMPTVSIAAFFADNGSWEFDKVMYQSDYENQQIMEQYREWNRMSTMDKVYTSLNSNKYKIIFSSWLASMWGSWVFVNRDKVMTTPQKLVQARMYAQAVTILLLLSTIVLAMKEQELNKDKPEPLPEWKKVLMEREAEQKAPETNATNHSWACT